jgi:chorismate mutase
MGLNVYHVPTSLICRGDMWRRFVESWVENAEGWTAIYNKHLAAYRKRQGIKNDHHPMPDLARTQTAEGTSYELPFWSYRTGEARERLFVLKRADGSHAPVDFGAVNIRPRALTLTMFVRLFLADVFIHGIGGALYDQITDGILGELFGTQPPYACVSAAWLLPLGQPLEGVGDVSELKSRRHHVMHNPQLAIDPFTAVKTDVAELITERKTLVKEIAESLATSRRDREAKEQRREWFRALHGVNVALHLKAPAVLGRIDREIAEAEKAAEENKVLLWREYFFGLHTMGSLGQFVDRVRRQENTKHETRDTKL